jgi:N-acetylglucosaminyldiphosphoundecaprenol N-acetyl-beta-D-mannosaminyltransferase
VTRISLMGMAVDRVDEREAVETILDARAHDRGGLVLTPNLEHLSRFRASSEVRAAFGAAELVVADGMPLVWASRLQRTPLPERVAGSDLIWSLSAAAAERGRSVFLLGGEPGAADRAAGVLRERAPGLEIAGVECPTVEPGRDAELDAAAAHVGRTRPDLVYVGLPLRKQLHAVRRLRAASPRSWFLGLGASLSFVAGDTARAPVWMRRTGLEWTWRLSQEPSRLWRRYLVDGLPCAAVLFGGALRRRVTGAGA